MTPTLFLLFFSLAALSVPIGLALIIATAVPMLIFTNLSVMSIAQKIFTACDSFTFMSVPFFVLCGGLLEKGGVSARLVNFANALVGHLPGGLAVVCFVASAFFGAISGSTTATVVAIGSIILPSMRVAGYDLRFSLATVASAGYLGVIIPPSIPMVTYGVSTGVSIGDMFMAGFIPGILLCGLMSIYCIYYGKKVMRNTANVQKFSWINLWETFKAAIPALLMPGIILGGIYGGIFTPTEAAAVAVAYGLLIGFLVYKELTWAKVYEIMKGSVVTSSMIYLIFAAAAVYGFIMTSELIPAKATALIIKVATGPISFLLMTNVLLLIVGTFMELNAAIMIVSPILVPVLAKYNISLVSFGIVMIVNLAIGALTPPLGVNLFVAAKLRDAKVDIIINKHLFAYITLSIIGLLLITFFPQIPLFLVNWFK